jgi:WD40 repeat protein
MSTWAAIFSPDGTTLATASSDQTLRLTDATTLRVKNILRGHEHEVWCVAFSPDGKMLASGGKDQKVMLWSGEARQRQNSFANRGSLRPFFSPDGKRLATASPPESPAATTIWNLNDGALANSIPGRRTVGFSADGTRLVRWAAGGKAIEFISLDSPNSTRVELQVTDEQSRGLEYQGFTPDWKIFFAIDVSGRVGIWETATGKMVKGFQGPPPPISAGALSPDGRSLALGAQQENFVRLYELGSGRESQLKDHLDTVRGLAFSPDGAMLASGSLDGTIRLWRTASGEALATLPGHMEETSDLAFAPDGRTLASVNVKHSVKLWHVATRRELVSWELQEAGDFVRFSPDGRFLAVTTRTNSVHLFEAPPLETLDTASR